MATKKQKFMLHSCFQAYFNDLFVKSLG